MIKDYLTSIIRKKGICLFFLSTIFFASQAIIAQTLPASDGGVVCFDCAPPGWIKGLGTPDISDATNASTVGVWDLGVLPLPPTGHTTWLSLRDIGLPPPNEEDVSVIMGSLIPGATYEVTIHSMSALSAAYSSVYIDEFTYQIGANPLQTISPVSQDVWATNTFQFIASATTETLFLKPGFNGAGGVMDESVQISVELNAIVQIAAPDIEITGNGQIIIDGQTTISIDDDTDFGELLIGVPVTRQFTINNVGNSDLTITIPLSINDLGSGVADFSITNPIIVVAGPGSTTFDVTFTPTVAGTQEVEISVVSDDPDEDPYTFNIRGTGLLDSDGDTVADIYDLDDDNDGILDTVEGLIDTDGDGVFNNLDLDSDNDGILDVVEFGNADVDNNGLIDGFTDIDSNGFNDSSDNPELYSQNNAASTFTEVNATAGWTPFGAGTVLSSSAAEVRNGAFSLEFATTFAALGRYISYTVPLNIGTTYNIRIWARRGTTDTGEFDNWSGFTGFAQTLFTNDDWTLYEWTLTANAALGEIQIYPHSLSTEVNGSIFIDEISIREVVTQVPPNNDTDVLPNFLDLDSDNDGIPDNIEAQPTISYVSPNVVYNANGVDTAYLTGLNPVNTDGAADNPDYLDLDSDDEGANDTTEAGLLLSGLVGANGLDTNSETLDTYIDVNGIFDNPQGDFPDSDGDIPFGGDVDYRDDFDDPDYDGDSVPDIGDLDDDNDGILDTDETGGQDPSVDGDGDNVPFYLDDDDGNAGVGDVNGVIEPGFDFDGDGIPNHFDLDSDNDGSPDVIEAGGIDANGDGILDGFVDADGDGLNDIVDNVDSGSGPGEVTTGTPLLDPNTDGDTLVDRLDLDSDNDGITDVSEAGGLDADGNGIIDGFTDVGIINGWDDATQTTPLTDLNTDGDSLPNRLDLDSDNDGVTDATEAGGTDVNGDGVIDGFTDAGPTNGLDDATETTPLLDPNTDGDTLVDRLDLDSDNDGVTDATEAGGTDANGDGVIDGFTDAGPINGLDDATETTPLANPNSDGDTVDDRIDLDSDNDGITDTIEAGGLDADGNGIIDGFTDAGPINGLDDATEITPLGNADTDSDTVVDRVDLDSDNDGITDAREAGGLDVDGNGIIDGFTDAGPVNGLDDATEVTPLPITDTDLATGLDLLPDYLDLDSDADGISDIIEAGGVDADGDAHVDYVTSGDPFTMTDVNSNGLLDVLETTPLLVPNTDGTGGEDYIDIDADGDGIVDNIEGQTTVGYNAPAPTDSDGDGLNDAYDADDENTVGIGGGGVAVPIIPVNTDGIGAPDYQDIDSDNDGDLDILEGWDLNNDGVVTPPGESAPVPGDTDGDGLDNGFDTDNANLDPTNGGTLPTDFPDLDIPGGDLDWRQALDIDWDNDGIDDPIDLDDDNDGIPDTDESGGLDPNADGDGDGVPFYLDDDDTNGAIGDTDGIEAGFDTDNDGVPNHQDLDSDNDGIYDVVESSQLNGVTIVDGNNDGILDGAPGLFGANGLLDALEVVPDNGILSVVTADSDTDGIPDSNELNADNDGCNDVTEAGFTDVDGAGRLGNDTGLMVDINGLVTTGTDGYTTPLDGDTNGIFDFQEVGQAVALTTQPVGQTIIINANANFDVTGTAAVYQWQESTDGGTIWTDIVDGGANPTYAGATTDALTLTTVPGSYNGYQYRVILSSPAFACDGDITSDEVVLNMFSDTDNDGIPDITDLDDDNDGIPDTDESGGLDPNADGDGDGVPFYLDDDDTNGAIGDTDGIEAGFDTDNDGVPNHLDLDSDNDGIFDIVESGQLNGGTIIDADNNGVLDGAPGLFGTNGLLDALEDAPDSGTLTLATADSDTDGIPDSNELNSDGDGCSDVLEAGFTDSDGSGRLGADAGLTVDSNGVVNTPGLTDGYTTPLDGDTNGIFDFQEVGAQVTLANQPMDQTITINSNANFDVTGVAPTFQWQESTNSGVTWNNIANGGSAPTYSGATTDALTLTFVPASFSGNQYRVILSSPAFACDGNITSNPATLTIQADFDGDGIGDPIDLDDDNDGIPDLVELNGLDPLADVDGDGVPAYLDDNDNNISVGDTDGIEAAYDLDGDGDPNHLDLDADGDGIYDVNEGGFADLDADNDGDIDGVPGDFGTNGLFDGLEDAPDSGTINYTPLDTDNDGIINVLDIDDDGDGVDTASENPDPNGNGDPTDAQDTDGDLIPDYLDIDDDNDGILTATEGTGNSDTDTFPNYLDQDSDGDGIADNVEGQSTAGYIAPDGVDTDGDGLDDAYDNFDNLTVNDPNNNGAATNGIQPVDSDAGIVGADGNPDYIDDDSDGDTVPDSIEGHDLNNDGVPDNFPTTDTDNDGLNDAFDGDITGFGDPNGAIVTTDPATDLPDTDGTEDVNYRDLDDDGDGIHTRFEDLNGDGDFANDDTDGDGIPNYLDNDDDGDGLLTADENPDPNGDGNPADAQDGDSDGIPDYLDDDDDNDGISTLDEDIDGDGDPRNDDTDGDGRPNYLDIDDDGDGIMTIVETDNDEDDDTHPNYLDLDSDDDGIPDNVEGQTTSGYIAPDGVDTDGDGLDDAYDNNASNTADNYGITNGIQPVNTDSSAVLNSDSTPDYLDTDSDGDTVPDSIEGHNFNAEFGPDIEPLNQDVDNDGLDDAYDSDLTGFGDPNGSTVVSDPATDLPNFDGVDEVNYRDVDDDNDGIDTAGEDGDMSGDSITDDCDEDGNPNYVDVIPCDRIPSGFSPNDDGNNDTFIVPALDQYKNFTMEVYDRYGNIVYDYDNAGREDPLWWDGFSTGARTIKKGDKVPVGTYYYIINFNEDRLSPLAGWVYVNY